MISNVLQKHSKYTWIQLLKQNSEQAGRISYSENVSFGNLLAYFIRSKYLKQKCKKKNILPCTL